MPKLLAELIMFFVSGVLSNLSKPFLPYLIPAAAGNGVTASIVPSIAKSVAYSPAVLVSSTPSPKIALSAAS